MDARTITRPPFSVSHARLHRIAAPPAIAVAAFLASACATGSAVPAHATLPPAASAGTTGAAHADPAVDTADAAGAAGAAFHRARTALPARWGATPPGVSHPDHAREIDLQHQSVRLRFDRTRRTVVGSTTLRVAAIGAARSAITLDAVGVRTSRVTSHAGVSLPFEQGDHTLVVRLPAPLVPGRATTITVEYEAPADGHASHLGDRPSATWLRGSLGLVSRWLPTVADPADAATWELLVRVSARERVLASGRLAAARASGHEVEYRWIQERAAPAHLLVLHAGDVIVLQDRWRSASMGYWTPATQVERSWQRLGRTPRVVELFSTLSGIDYAWPAYDQALIVDGDDEGALVPGVAMALHVVGAADGGEADVARDDADVARLLAHQWFDARVTPRSWGQLWLTDGVAAFMAQQFVAQEHGEAAGRLMRHDARERALAADVVARRPLPYDRWRADPTELRASAHAADRGALVLQMLRRELGDSLFWRAFRAYASGSAHRLVDTGDLRRSFEASAARSLEGFFRQWVYGAGYPVLDVRTSYDSASRLLRVVVRQVQPRDSLTGLFVADAELRVVTDVDTVTIPVPIRGETTEVSRVLSGIPRTMRFDPDGWLLARTRFHRAPDALRRQLRDADPTARFDALRALDVAGDTAALPVIRELLARDAEWRVRATAAAVLGSLRALAGGAARDGVIAVLREAAARDTSALVRAAALEAAARSLAEVADSVAMREVEALATEWLTAAGSPANRRLAAVRALAPLGGRTRASDVAVLGALGDASPGVRRAAASAVAERGDAASLPALERRLAAERDPLVRNALEDAIAALGRR